VREREAGRLNDLLEFGFNAQTEFTYGKQGLPVFVIRIFISIIPVITVVIRIIPS
jgi:hypothetical protein